MNKYTKYISSRLYKFMQRHTNICIMLDNETILMYFYKNAFKQTQEGRAWSWLAGKEKDKPNPIEEDMILADRGNEWLPNSNAVSLTLQKCN